MTVSQEATLPPLPRPKPRGLGLILAPVVEFLHTQAAGGIVLLGATVLALIWANSPWAGVYHDLWHTTVGLRFGNLALVHPLEWWINDGLMVLFFYVVGLEIKRELVAGELRDPRKAALPAAAALGGMLVPALIYYLLQRGQPGQHGWGVPMATDIAFAVGVLTLFGPRVPTGLKIMLLSLAIVDDLGAVLVIAMAYSTDLSISALGWAGGGVLLVGVLRLLRVRILGVYGLLAVGVWLAMTQSGIHPTLAGVVLGLLTPSRSLVTRERFVEILDIVRIRLEGRGNEKSEDLADEVNTLVRYGRRSLPLLDQLLTLLHPWVAFLIMPLFALANAGVAVEIAPLSSPVALAVAVGLVVGKPLGIVLFSLVAVKVGMARLPDGMNTGRLWALGCLGGIGFTMSLFIASLGFQGELLTAGKVGTLLGSLVSAVMGSVLLLLTLPRMSSGNHDVSEGNA